MTSAFTHMASDN